MHEVIVYSRKQCHLCDELKDQLRRLEPSGLFAWREVDIDGDLELQRIYMAEVPVVFIDGRKAFTYRVNEAEFLKRVGG